MHACHDNVDIELGVCVPGSQLANTVEGLEGAWEVTLANRRASLHFKCVWQYPVESEALSFFDFLSRDVGCIGVTGCEDQRDAKSLEETGPDEGIL
jgi:hypothetical protein